MAVATQQTPTLPQTSLYVGDLHPMLTESVLHAKFSEIGNVLSVRICRDLATRNSLGYGYVNFDEPKDAERALEHLNYEELMGRPMRIMWSQRDPSLRKSGRGNIFIKNLDKSIEQKELYDTFGFFGRILSCKIAMDEHGVSKGYGFVHFEKEECAEKAIEKINGMLIRDRVVFVGRFIPKNDRKSHNDKIRFNNIYVKNFHPETTEEQLREMFSEFGEIKSCCLEKDAEGKSKGFGFVCYSESDDAEMAVKTLHGKEINGRTLYCTRAQRKAERQEELKQRLEKQRAERQQKYIPGVNLYVKNLDDNIDDERLKETFSQYGPITSAKVMTDANGRSKGFGFVCFTQPEQAARAVTEMNATIVGSKPLYVALAQRKEDRRARLITEHHQRLVRLTSSVGPMLPPGATHVAPNYFPPAAFQQAQRFYHTGGAVLSSQPRWSRATGLAGGMSAHMGGALPTRPHVPYIGAPNAQAGLTPNQMAAMTQFRPTAMGRPMVPGGMPAGIPTGPPMHTSAMMNGNANQQRHQAVSRPSMQMPQVYAQQGVMPQRPSMASVVAAPTGNNPNVRIQRGVMHPNMSSMPTGTSSVRFNQTARNVSAPQMPPQMTTMTSVLSPLSDQSPLTISALAQLPEEEQKRTLGERLFPQVRELYPTLASKLTGMLLGVDNSEVIHLLESKEALKAKVEEAVSVLQNNQNVSNNLPEEGRSVTADKKQVGQNGDSSLDMKSDANAPADVVGN